MLGEVLKLEDIYMDDGVTPYRVRIAESMKILRPTTITGIRARTAMPQT
jgi:hypothetical protein